MNAMLRIQVKSRSNPSSLNLRFFLLTNCLKYAIMDLYEATLNFTNVHFVLDIHTKLTTFKISQGKWRL